MIKTSCLKSDFQELKLINPTTGLYKVSWDKIDTEALIFAELTPEQKEAEKNGEIIEREILGYEDTDYCTYMYEFIEKPSVNQIKAMILNYYNSEIDKKILEGFVWNDMPVWLSTENQFNYKAAYDLAVQTKAQTLPVTFKFGTTENPVYHTFETMGEFTDFYMKAMTYINTCLQEGWVKKDSINWDNYDTTKIA